MRTSLNIKNQINFNTKQKYKTIYLDPPWPERGGARLSVAQTNTTI